MPSSSKELIPEVLHHLMTLQPKSILDIGVGFGKVGFLAREYLEVWNHRYHKKDWKIRIYGIEAFDSYCNENWAFAYDEVLIGDAMKVFDTIEPVEVITFLDVIEHFEKAQGKAFLEQCIKKANYVIVSSPLTFWNQGVKFGNEYEIHRSHWTEADFKSYNYIFKPLSYTFVCLLWARREGVNPEQVYLNRLVEIPGKEIVKELVSRVARRLRLKKPHKTF